MKQEPAYFEGQEPILIYIAKKLKDALQLEDLFTAAGVDYGVEADEYRAGVIFRSAIDAAQRLYPLRGPAPCHWLMSGN